MWSSALDMSLGAHDQQRPPDAVEDDARQKRRVGVALGSRAMTADAFQTDACFWLSLFLLVGIGANALFGWWWADPLAALGMTFFIGREAVEAWRGEVDD